MIQEIIIAGFGGQGVLFTGMVLAQAGLEEGLNVTYFPSYGAEMRGGTANSTVVISEQEIGSPVVVNPAKAVILNQMSWDKFCSRVKKTGLIILNSSLVQADNLPPDVRVVKVPATEIADQLGNVRVANMVSLGALVKESKIVSLGSAFKAVEKALGARKEGLVKINQQALKRGFEGVQ